MIVVPFIPAHLEDLSLQPGQSELAEYMDQPEYGDMLVGTGYAYTLMHDGVVKMIGGLLEQVDGRALAWTLISSKATGSDLIYMTRLLRREIEASGYRRVEAVVKDGFEQGHRWMRLLGFKCETPDGMLNWYKDKGTAYLYARSGI